MANHKSAKKRARQDIKRRARNLSIKKAIRTTEKRLRGAIESKSGKEAAELLKSFTSGIDKASKSGIFHVNTAARKVGRLAKQVSQIK